MPPVGLPDLYVTTENAPTVAPQSIAAAATVHGASVAVKDRESVVLEMHVGSVTGSPTGGTITMTPEESADGATFTQVNTDTVVANYNDTVPEILRYRYLGGANGKQPYVRMSITTALTGGTSPTALVAGNVLKGALKYSGAQPKPGSYPQTPGTPLTN